ncbi:MAG: redox-regulated ATPase YchF, partial [bacterium]|nr:redox-regulated ATPase YchF [bacterium]
VGLPNVGKSTLFKALTQKQIDIANYPFCTIQPNSGIVKVPDERLSKLAALNNSENIIPASIEFVDIAGLVKGAHTGEGLGNQFLAHIREVDAIAHVVRVFKDTNIIHVSGEGDPIGDIETINLELIFADLATIEKRLIGFKAQLKAGQDKALLQHIDILERVKKTLEEGKLAHTLPLSEEEKKLVRDCNLLTIKPFIFILNTDESGSIDPDIQKSIEPFIKHYPHVILCGKLEAETTELSLEELAELGMTRTGLDTLISLAYKTLSLITYFTSGPKETRAWTIKQGTKAPQAAGVIHTDFEKGFIRAEIISWKDLFDTGGEVAAKEKGLMRLEGKEYIMNDGDVAVFRFAS